jgi:hypothetical protein
MWGLRDAAGRHGGAAEGYEGLYRLQEAMGRHEGTPIHVRMTPLISFSPDAPIYHV